MGKIKGWTKTIGSNSSIFFVHENDAKVTVTRGSTKYSTWLVIYVKKSKNHMIIESDFEIIRKHDAERLAAKYMRRENERK